MSKETFDIVVIGSGPGGYVAAIRAAQLGNSVALIEANELGGVCLNRGCIPSKTLIASAEVLHTIKEAAKHGISCDNVSFDYKKIKERKDEVVSDIRQGLSGLIASNKIRVFKGYGKFISPHEIRVVGEDDAVVEGRNIILATGSAPRSLPLAPFDHKLIHDSTSMLNITKLPKRVLIIGGGVIGCEFACLHASFGVDVTIVELLPSLITQEGKHVSDALEAALVKKGIKVKTSTVIERVTTTDSTVTAHLANGETIEADMALVSVGRKYNTDNLGLEKTGVIVEDSGAIETNERMQTNVAHIYAIGDITGKWVLAHVASHQGLVAADNASGTFTKMHYNAVPSVIFTSPEIGTIGYTLERAIEEGYDATLGNFPFQALGKSQAAAQTEGFAQIVIAKRTGQILGAQVVGHSAATLIAEMAVAIGNELTVHSISETIHAHPTVAEAWMEAALLAQEKPLHLPPKKGR